MNQAELQRKRSLRQHIQSMVFFVNKYCDLVRSYASTNIFVETFTFLPDAFKDVILENINNALDDSPLIEIYLGILPIPHRVDLLVNAYTMAYSEDFTDSEFIQWATMTCTISSLLYTCGFDRALEIAEEEIYALCNHFKRYQAFLTAGCNI